MEASNDVTKDANENTLLIIHAGSNDVKRTRSEELLEKYRKTIQRYKTKSKKIIISGILPKIGTDSTFYDKAFSTNTRLISLCQQEGVEYINLWNNFYGQRSLFQQDGTHLNSVGSARMGRLLHEAVHNFTSKNFNRTEVDSAT